MNTKVLVKVLLKNSAAELQDEFLKENGKTNEIKGTNPLIPMCVPHDEKFLFSWA